MNFKKNIVVLIAIFMAVSTLNALSTTSGYNKSMVKTSMDLLELCRIASTYKHQDSAGPNSIKSALKRKGYSVRRIGVYKSRRVVYAINTKQNTAILIYAREKNDIQKVLRNTYFRATKGTKIWKHMKINKYMKHAYDSMPQKEIFSALEHLPKKYKIFVTGFGLSGASASLAAYELKVARKKDVVLYTFGSPRVGGQKFLDVFYAKVKKAFRIAVDKDPLPMLPPRKMGYTHVGNLLQLTPSGHRVPAPEIKPKWRTMQRGLHKISVYQKALKKHFAECKQMGPSCYKKGVLEYSADIERK